MNTELASTHMFVPALAQEIGLEEAVFLQQLHFAIKAQKPAKIAGWIRVRNLGQLSALTPYIPKERVRQLVVSLRGIGLIQTNPPKASTSEAAWYHVTQL